MARLVEQLDIDEEIDGALLDWAIAHHGGALPRPCARLMRMAARRNGQNRKHDPEKHALAKARDGYRFSEKACPRECGDHAPPIMLSGMTIRRSSHSSPGWTYQSAGPADGDAIEPQGRLTYPDR